MKGFREVPLLGYTVPVKGLTDTGAVALGLDSDLEKDAKPFASWLPFGGAGKALWVLGAGKLADCGKTADVVGTNLLDSPVDALLKGLLGEREGCVLAVEVNGLENVGKLWGLETGSVRPGELVGVELEDTLLPKTALYCGGPLGGAAPEESEKTLSSCDRAAYLSWDGGTGGVELVSGCWPRPPKSTLMDLGNARKGAGPPTEETDRPEGRGRAGKEGVWLWGPMPGETVLGRCLSRPPSMESLICGSLKLWERDGRAVKTSVRRSAGETEGALSQEDS